MDVLFLITGGTIDSHYDPITGTAKVNKETVIPTYIESLHLHGKQPHQVIYMKDSADMDDQDRRAVEYAIKTSSHRHIIITQGTSKMTDTAQYLLDAGIENKVIVFTGAMIPLQGFGQSDAPFNLGFALGTIGSLEPGMYVCMNGKTFTADNVIKNHKEGRFYPAISAP